MRIGLGCVGLGTAAGGRRSTEDVRFVETAIERGFTVLDTANTYGSGMSERIVGRAVRGHRDDVVLATKVGYRFRPRSRLEFAARREAVRLRRRLRGDATAADAGGGSGGSYAEQDFSPTALRAALDASLQRLGTDHIDVYQLHGPSTVLPDALGVLRSFVAEGKVGRVGIGAETLASAAAWSNVPGVDVIQLPIGVLDPQATTITTGITDHGIEIWARGVYGGGLLGAASRGSEAVRQDPKWPLIDALRALAERHGLSLFDLAFGFVRATPGVSTILLGMSTAAHLDQNLAIARSAPLEPVVLADIRALHAECGTGLEP